MTGCASVDVTPNAQSKTVVQTIGSVPEDHPCDGHATVDRSLARLFQEFCSSSNITLFNAKFTGARKLPAEPTVQSRYHLGSAPSSKRGLARLTSGFPAFMQKIILLTGFEPFNHELINPAWEAVQTLAGWRTEEFRVETIQLPCVFGRAARVLDPIIAEKSPDVVIAVGQAGGRSEISIERVAINVDDAPILDNAGNQPVDCAIVRDGPAAYFSTLPIKAIVRAVRAGGIPAVVSQSAGTFVCNHVFYALMDLLAHLRTVAGAPATGGFIHVPYLPQQAAAHPGQPSMALADIVEGLRIAILVSATGDPDLKAAEGRLD